MISVPGPTLPQPGPMTLGVSLPPSFAWDHEPEGSSEQREAKS